FLLQSSGGFRKPSLHSNVLVTMVFLGKNLHLTYRDTTFRDEIRVCQQHCGGENLCVYKGMLLEGDTFQITSRRHHGFPFSLTFYLNGLQVDRLSCCCEFKLQQRSRLGGKRGYFGFVRVEGAAPCYRCLIAMNMDKKLSPPKKAEKSHEEKHMHFLSMQSQPGDGSVGENSRKDSVVVILPSPEACEDELETGEELREEEREELSDDE
ncbi:ERIC3 protein, partial [Ramphastos sulfuratus]|nr:ERIC3 protein [Ramphastos sulfuratus]